MKAIESNREQSSPALPELQPASAIDFGHLSPETAITLRSAGREYRITANDVIKWVAPGAPLSEAVRLLIVSQTVNLNPMLKEIELLNIKGSWHVYVRKQGLVKVAQRYPEYDGHDDGVVIQVKDLSSPPIDVSGEIVPRGYLLLGGWARVFRKGWSRPIYKRVALQNYQRDKGIWQENPAVMITKTALSQALRESFPIGEIYDESELPGVIAQASITQEAAHESAIKVALPETEVLTAELVEEPLPPIPTPPASSPDVPVLPDPDPADVEDAPPPSTPDQHVAIADLAIRIGMGPKPFAAMLARRGVETVDQLDQYQAATIIHKLEEKVSAKEWNPLADKSEADKQATA